MNSTIYLKKTCDVLRFTVSRGNKKSLHVVSFFILTVFARLLDKSIFVKCFFKVKLCAHYGTKLSILTLSSPRLTTYCAFTSASAYFNFSHCPNRTVQFHAQNINSVWMKYLAREMQEMIYNLCNSLKSAKHPRYCQWFWLKHHLLR